MEKAITDLLKKVHEKDMGKKAPAPIKKAPETPSDPDPVIEDDLEETQIEIPQDEEPEEKPKKKGKKGKKKSRK